MIKQHRPIPDEPPKQKPVKVDPRTNKGYRRRKEGELDMDLYTLRRR